jgi:queuine/archaeosine tRNA-ribosyltransferase
MADDSTLIQHLFLCLSAVLPAGKPRYVMGIGYPLDVVVCSAL